MLNIFEYLKFWFSFTLSFSLKKVFFENFDIFINNTICVESAKVLWKVCLNIHSLSISIHKVQATSSIKPV